MSIEAKNIWAVVVGIDHYGEGFPKLKHQVESACGFVRWLIGRGVPPSQIYLHLSPQPDPTVPEVNLCDTSENTIFDTLNREIRNSKGDLLYIYWGGHGIVAGEDRTLITADAKVDAVRSIDLNSLLSSLRSEYFGFSQQAVLVDACARHFPDRNRVNPRLFTQGRKLPAQRQFVLYSAAEAESATDGLFSAAMLKWLESADKSPAVPDLERMAKDIQRHFIQLRAEGKTHQTPVYFSHKPWEDEEKALIGESRFLSLLPEARERLRKIKKWSSTDWQYCYRRALRNHDEDFVAAESLDQALNHLARSVTAKRIELLLEFVWRVAERLELEDLRKWVIGKVDSIYKLEDLKKRMRIEGIEEGRRTVYLMIEIIEDLKAAPRAFNLQSWFYHSAGAVSLAPCRCGGTEDSLHEAVCGILDDLESGCELNDQDDLAIELFVETRMLNCRAEEEKHRYAPLGSKYPLVLRWHTRLLKRSPKTRSWRRVAEWIHKRMEVIAQPSILWVPDDVSGHEKLAARINGQFDHSFLGFTDKQAGEGEDSVGICLMAALENGVPYAFFPRKEVTANFKSAFIKKIHEMDNWDDLPRALMEMRLESIGNDGHPAENVTLLWDDPRRMPPLAIPLSIEES